MSEFKHKYALGQKVIFDAKVFFVHTISCGSTSERKITLYRLITQLPDVYFAGGTRTDAILEENIQPWTLEVEEAIKAAEATLRKFGRSHP